MGSRLPTQGARTATDGLVLPIDVRIPRGRSLVRIERAPQSHSRRVSGTAS